MKFHFTTTGYIYSRLIRWGLGEDCSHFAIEFDKIEGKPVVVESIVEKGVRECSSKKFLKENKVVHSLEYIGEHSIDSMFYDCVNMHAKESYDVSAILYWALAAIAKKSVGLEKPKENPWGSDRSKYCVEILDGCEILIKQYLGVNVSKIDWEMVSPMEAYKILRKSDKLRES